MDASIRSKGVETHWQGAASHAASGGPGALRTLQTKLQCKHFTVTCANMLSHADIGVSSAIGEDDAQNGEASTTSKWQQRVVFLALCWQIDACGLLLDHGDPHQGRLHLKSSDSSTLRDRHHPDARHSVVTTVKLPVGQPRVSRVRQYAV